ncbi:EamA family transporter RarD [Jeotgalibacillus sp. ET6]|uniref:EamA family transporter RarD n=1 Tax=Jeotgalibacillus sp. ET6 TaxID=3037260 RepID=UPI0024189B7E|nr:EamA family transporter RarD [Jeotgalibacillus sp. ET6]MDG5471075.1 EamA family transporter RarD [Jeotgalibacillus sp. ET6]
MENEEKKGIFFAAFAYALWGLLPIYWKFLSDVSPDEILANRVFWSFWFMMVLLAATGNLRAFKVEGLSLLKKKKRLLALFAASALISLNWFFYIWAVNTNQMVEASLGYYINPLVSVLLGVIVLKEVLSKAQVISFILALIGVLIITISYGVFPWIAFTLAFSFGLYGLVKKMIKVDPAIGLTLETLTIMPAALIYMGFLFQNSSPALFAGNWNIDLLLIGAGAATAVPLLFFAKGAQKIPLYMIGFLQYIAPTLTLILGIFIYNEPFTLIDLISFVFIWSSLTLFTFSRSKWYMARPRSLKKAAGQ